MTAIKEITFERTYDAPIATVWQAWTNPEMLQKWWGPNNVTIAECEVDLRVGGRFYIVMEAGAAMGDYQGTLWPMEATFTLIDEPNKLSYNAKAWTEGQPDTTIEQTQELTLSETNGKTTITLKAAIHAAGSNAGMAVEGMKWGYTQQLDKLQAFLQK